jgi:hypothetical protein
MKSALNGNPGSARASRVGFGALAETIFSGKVRDGEAAIGRTQGACAPQILP